MIRLLVTLSLLSLAAAHISLTFPLARFPQLDFLDNTRTMEPCGVEKSAISTTLQTNTNYNITWRLLPHQGGYRVSLLNPTLGTKTVLPGPNGYGFTNINDGRTVHTEPLSFNETCEGCILLVERQAVELGTNFRYRSCADINIVDTTTEVCNGRGTINNGACSCESGFAGKQCQYLAKCQVNDDCMNDGVCERDGTTDGETLVQKRCYCTYGFFGDNCEKQLNKDNDGCFAYFKTIEQNYTKYGMFNPSCYNKVTLNTSDIIYYRTVGIEVEIILDYLSTSWVSLGWKPLNLDKQCRLLPDIDNAPTSTQNAVPKNYGQLKSALEATLTPHDCMDMVVGMVVNGRARFMDLWSRDRSTPLEDTAYGGQMSLSAAYGLEQDGRTVIMFRRTTAATDVHDQPLGPGEVYVAWAKGMIGNPNFQDDLFKNHGESVNTRGVLAPIDFGASVQPEPTPSVATSTKAMMALDLTFAVFMLN